MNEDAQQMELHAPETGGLYSSQLKDWIPVCPQLRDSAVRLYWILRALVVEKRGPVRKLTLAQLCYLLPAKPAAVGEPVKPSSLARIRSLMDELTAVGLITTPEGERIRTSSRAGASSAPLRIRVNDRPAEGYAGPRNAYEVLDAIKDPAAKAAKAAVQRERVREAERRAARKAEEAAEAGQISDPLNNEGAGQIFSPSGQIFSPSGQIFSPSGQILSPQQADDLLECAPSSDTPPSDIPSVNTPPREVGGFPSEANEAPSVAGVVAAAPRSLDRDAIEQPGGATTTGEGQQAPLWPAVVHNGTRWVSREAEAENGAQRGPQGLPQVRTPRQAPAMELPEDFDLTAGMRVWAQQTYPRVDVDHATAKFVSYQRGEGNRRRNWYEAWQRWITDENAHLIRLGAPAAGDIALPGQVATARPSTTDQRVQQALDAGRRLQALADARRANG